jgi:UDP-N-acetylglucosamine 2-epimerase (non-hydrolysing)
MKRITIIAGARPNFMKIAPIIHVLNEKKAKGEDIGYRLVHTGQHYDKKMSDDFFSQLNIPPPDINLHCGGGSQAEQTAQIMVAFEKDLLANPCDLILVVGDVTSTLACSIVGKKCNTKVAHVEGGIRSGDMSMPEEINRIVTDSISDYFFTTTDKANDNLKRSGVSSDRIFLVGNTMIDTLLKQMPDFAPPQLPEIQQIIERKYLMLTLHRPSNVDDPEKLKKLLETIDKSSNGLTILFPAHPRTKKMLEHISIQLQNLVMLEPLGYLEFNYLVQHSSGVITDSGGITEEASVMNIPCLTLRNSTERPETVEKGTNVLIGDQVDKIPDYIDQMLNGNWKQYTGIPYWDGKTAKRIVDTIISLPR